jgi:hypothetical protein
MTTTYARLYVCRLNEEFHRRTCGYWYTVTDYGTPHTAFVTRAGLDRWMSERGLSLAGSLNEVPSHCAIVGAYRTESHLHDAADFAGLEGEHTRTLSNGDWVEAIITHDPDGLRTVHTLNPNVRDRKTFDYRESCALMS